MQGHCHGDVADVPCCACEHARSAATPSRRLPLSLLAQAHVASTQYTAIKGSHLCISSMSVKDRVVLALMASLELCTDHMSGFMGSDKLSSFCNYYVEPHLPALCGAFTFGGRMRPRAKTSSWEQGHDFDIVWTYEWLSYMKASRSKAYGVLVRFFLCRVYINSSRRDTLGYEWQLLCCSHLVVCLVYCWWIRGVGYGYVQDYNISICNCLPLTLTWVNILLIYACSSL
jgi:hypothetical protein